MTAQVKAQAAFEYIMVFIIVLSFVIPVWFYLISMQADTTNELYSTWARIAVDNMAEKADLVYSQGMPAMVTIKVYIPRNIIDAFFDDKTIVLQMRVNSHESYITSTSTSSLSGYIPSSEGVYSFVIESIDNYVKICPDGEEFEELCQ